MIMLPQNMMIFSTSVNFLNLFKYEYLILYLIQAERKEKLEKLHNEQLKAEEVLEKVSRRSKKKAILDKQKDNAELTKESDTSKNTINGKGEKKGGESTGNMDINGEVKDSDSETSSRESSVEKEIDESTDSENIVSEKDSLENDKIKNTGVESETSDSLFESKEKSASDRIDAKEDSNSLNEEPDNRNSEDTVDSSQNGPFSTETTKCDQAHYSFLSDKDESVNRNIVSGFKVIKIEDADNGLFEVNVSAACLKVCINPFIISGFCYSATCTGSFLRHTRYVHFTDCSPKPIYKS